MIFRNNQSVLTSFLIELATLGPIGRYLPAPGTWGALAATVVTPFIIFPLSIVPRIILLIIVFVLGSFGAQKAEQMEMIKDPGIVNIDEVLGQWITFLPFTWLSWPNLLLGFVLFRLFDIFKPWPVNISENWLSNGWNVMIDDVFAAIYAMACLAILRLILQAG